MICCIHLSDRPRDRECRDTLRRCDRRRQKFGQVTADHQHRFSGAREFINQAVNFRFARDINAARGLVKQQHVHVMMQEARDRDFLLVSPR